MAAQTKPKAGSLEARLTALARRVEELEREDRRHPKRSVRGVSEALGSDLALLEQLRKRQGRRYQTKEMRGAVAYGGAAVFGEREYLWIREHPLPEIAELEPDRLAQALATLGHPSRLVLLRALLQHARTSQELQAILGVSSPGQLYHHLKELLAAGIVTQTRRSRYEIAARQVVPVLVVLAAAADLVDTTSATSEIEEVALEKGVRHEHEANPAARPGSAGVAGRGRPDRPRRVEDGVGHG